MKKVERINTVSMSVVVIFGNPRLNCRKFGICQIQPYSLSDGKYEIRARKSQAQVIITESKFTIKFLKTSMTTQTQKTYFLNPKNIFRLDNDLLSSKFSIFSDCETFKIAQGSYPVEQDNEHYIVSFLKVIKN